MDWEELEHGPIIKQYQAGDQIIIFYDRAKIDKTKTYGLGIIMRGQPTIGVCDNLEHLEKFAEDFVKLKNQYGV